MISVHVQPLFAFRSFQRCVTTRMYRSTSAPTVISGFLSSFLLALAGQPALGQTGPQPLDGVQFGVGYVANAPQAMAGVSGYVIVPRWGGIGLYVDAKIDVTGPSKERGYDPQVTVAQIQGGQFGEELIKSEGSWRSANAAVLHPITPFLALYGGGGVAQKRHFRLYQVNRNSGVGVGGVVWAEDPQAEETRVNIMAGMVMRLTARVSSHFGVETQPRGLTVGASLRLPRW